jgi:hypothetical protein
MRGFGSLITVLLATVLVFAAVPRRADFSGMWIFNMEKSMPRPTPQHSHVAWVTVAQTADSITIERFFVNPQGQQHSYRESFSFNSEESQNALFGGRIKKSTVRWSADKQKLTIRSRIFFPNKQDSASGVTTEVIRLLNKGATLSVEATVVSSRGTSKATAVFDREKPVVKPADTAQTAPAGK